MMFLRIGQNKKIEENKVTIRLEIETFFRNVGSENCG